MRMLVFWLLVLMAPSLLFANEIKAVEGLYTIKLDNDWNTSSFRKDDDNYYVSYAYAGKKEIGFREVNIHIDKFKSQTEIEYELSEIVSWVVNTPFTMESSMDFINLKRYGIENLRFTTEYHQSGKSHFYVDYYFVVDDYLIRVDFPTSMVGDWDYYYKNIHSFIYEIKFKK